MYESQSSKMSNETDRDVGRVYRILGQLYLEPPTDSTVADVAAWADRWLETGSDTLAAEIREPLEALRAAEPGDVETLRSEFTRLFRGATKQPSPDPPYESLYREDTIYGATTTEVRRSYREAGLDITDDENREPPDQLGIELQFLGELRDREDEDPDVRELERAFIDDHLGEWIGEFRQAVEASDPPPFYRAVLDLTEGLVHVERARLDQPVE